MIMLYATINGQPAGIVMLNPHVNSGGVILGLGAAGTFRGVNFMVQANQYFPYARFRGKSSWASGFQRTWTSWYDKKIPMPVKDMGLMLHEADKNQPLNDRWQVTSYGMVDVGDDNP